MKAMNEKYKVVFIKGLAGSSGYFVLDNENYQKIMLVGREANGDDAKKWAYAENHKLLNFKQ
jgi:hypothetical protein